MKYNKLVVLKDNRVSGTLLDNNFIPNLNEWNKSGYDKDNLQVFHTHTDIFMEKRYTNEVLEWGFDDDIMYCYTLEPFGGLGNFLGVSDSYDIGCFERIKDEVKHHIKNTPNVYVLVLWPHESTLGQSELSLLHEKLKENNIPPEKVVYVMNRNWSLQKDYDVIMNNPKNDEKWYHLEGQKKINFVNFDYFLIEKGIEAVNDNFYEDRSFLQNKRDKRFICLNKRLAMRWHRMLTICLANKDGFLDENYFSYDTEYQGMQNKVNWHSIPGKISQFYDLLEVQNSYTDLIKNRPVSHLDFTDFNSITGFRTEAEEYYKNSYFSLVTETMHFEPIDFNTEKIFKPICHFHPFLLLGRPGNLKKLHDFGFKTFSEFWDESYDDEQDDAKRFKMVYDIFYKLNKMDKDELHNLYLSMIPILEHNYSLICKYGNNRENEYKKLEQKIIECTK